MFNIIDLADPILCIKSAWHCLKRNLDTFFIVEIIYRDNIAQGYGQNICPKSAILDISRYIFNCLNLVKKTFKWSYSVDIYCPFCKKGLYFKITVLISHQLILYICIVLLLFIRV